MPIRFIAEVSSNHNLSLERCLEFVDAAARIGCDAVKFQLFRIDQLFAPEILSRSESNRQRKQWELPLGFRRPLPSAVRNLESRLLVHRFSCSQSTILSPMSLITKSPPMGCSGTIWSVPAVPLASL